MIIIKDRSINMRSMRSIMIDWISLDTTCKRLRVLVTVPRLSTIVIIVIHTLIISNTARSLLFK